MENIMDGALDEALRSHFDEDYEKDPKNAVISHAMSRNPISDVVFNPSSLKDVNPVFSIDIKTMSALNQRQSGRCWIFAGLNLCSEIIAKNLKMDDFELSVSHSLTKTFLLECAETIAYKTEGLRLFKPE